MNTVRKIKKVMKSQPTLEGAGVHLKRAFGYAQAPQLDPFLLLDDFHSNNPSDYLPGFPWHPHRGIETITYMLHGQVEHGDSLGNRGLISAGDVQWMTAGSGIVHQEMPKGDHDGSMSGFQLWANLPASHKMMEPRYRDVQNSQIPVVELDNGARIKVICGQVEGVKGSVQDILTDPEYLDVSLPAGSTFTRPFPEGYTVFAYTIKGHACFGAGRDPYEIPVEGSSYFNFERDCWIGPESLVIFGDQGEFLVESGQAGVRFLLISGRPIDEPVAWYGPIVMNTQEELRVAFEEYRKGTFLKHR